MKPAEPLDRLRSDGLDRLWRAARSRLENNGVRLTAVPLRLDELDDDETEALCILLGRRRPKERSMKIDLRELDELLRSSAAGLDLVAVLGALGGPVRDRKAERLAKNLAEVETRMFVDHHPAADEPDVRRWIESVRRRGRLTRLQTRGADSKDTMGGALDAVRWLLANADALRSSPIPLPMLAAVQVGDAHALDPDTAVGALLVDALKALSGAGDDRSAWGSFGVQLDQVSYSALVLNLPGVDGSICGAATRDAQPLRITWRMVEHDVGLDLDEVDGLRVRLCENPAIVSLAADQLGAHCEPLVCTEGMPAGVTSAVIDRLAAAGADLRVHADFDAGGLAIVQYAIRRFDATPWRMSRANYLQALTGPTADLAQQIGATDWDPTLADAMNTHRRAIHEEAIASELLEDLSVAR